MNLCSLCDESYSAGLVEGPLALFSPLVCRRL